jgi:hypothetical protein
MTRTPREVAESYWRAEASRSVEAVLANFHQNAVSPGGQSAFWSQLRIRKDKFDHVTAYFDPAQFPNPGAGE